MWSILHHEAHTGWRPMKSNIKSQLARGSDIQQMAGSAGSFIPYPSTADPTGGHENCVLCCHAACDRNQRLAPPTTNAGNGGGRQRPQPGISHHSANMHAATHRVGISSAEEALSNLLAIGAANFIFNVISLVPKLSDSPGMNGSPSQLWLRQAYLRGPPWLRLASPSRQARRLSAAL